MSSTHPPPATVVRPYCSSAPDLVDDCAVNGDHYSNTLLDASLLSPYDHNQGISSSASPSYNLSTPGDSYSEYSNYESSVVEDEFWGVNFDALNRIDSLPSANPSADTYQHVDANRNIPDIPIAPHLDDKTSSEPHTASTTYPLSPIHSSLQNTPSPAAATNGSSVRTTVSPHELTKEVQPLRYPTQTSLAPTHLAAVQLTPDHSGSSRASADRLEPGTMTHLERNRHLGNESNMGNSQLQDFAHFGTHYRGPSASSQAAAQSHGGAVLRNDDGEWKASEPTGQGGLSPEHRESLVGVEIPSLKQQKEQRRIEKQNLRVQQWKSEASSDTEDEHRDRSYFTADHAEWPHHPEPQARENMAPEGDDDDDGGILPVDDAVSIHHNRLVEGQTYYSFRDVAPNEVDMQLLNQPRHWNDTPSLPYTTDTQFQPQTANDAMKRWNGMADTYSISSRVATWGTRRRSEPSLLDYDAVADGSLLKKLSITRPDGGRRRQSSRFEEGLDRLANIVRNRSDSKLLKRRRSSQNSPVAAEDDSHPRHNSQGSLAVPGRSSSFGKTKTPSINTAVAAMTGSLAAVGTTHARSGSIGGTTTSPKSPLHLGIKSVMRRARSKSDISAQPGLFGLLRDHGGPPVARLASSLDPEPKQMQKQQSAAQEPQEEDEDEDEDDEDQAEERDVKVEQHQETEPIVPNYEGFKNHVRRLNPDMDPQYNWLVSRIAYQQETRYKGLLELRVKHQQAVLARDCASGPFCFGLGGSAQLMDAKGNRRGSERSIASLQLVTEFSDDSNPGEGALNSETFPQGVPLPPTRNLPAEFECQLCFKAKKFQKPSDWTKHVHEDVQPFTCTWDKCKDTKSFKRKADWVRHENERHRHLEWWICQFEDCKHPCYRKDNFLQHLVREHKLPEPKQKTKAAIKKARFTEQVWIMLDKCHHETPKRPQDEPCKFCGKSFTTWKKLTVHLAKHMENISLPVLQLVNQRIVDANTIISPVEQNLTPITPVTHTKIESSASPFDIENIAPHVTIGFPPYFQTTGPMPAYEMHAPVSQPQEMTYDQGDLYQQNLYSAHKITPPRGYGSLDASGINHVNQTRPFGPSIDASYPQPQQQQTRPRPYGSIDSSFPVSHPLPNTNQSYITHHHQASDFAMSQPFVTGTPAVSGYQTSNLMGTADPGYGFEHMTVNNAASHQQQNFQDVPTSRAMGSASPYGRSPGHQQQNGGYYG